MATRAGLHSGAVAVQPDGSLLLSLSWAEPHGGCGTDHWAVVSPARATAGGGAGSVAAIAGGGTSAAGAAASLEDVLVVTSILRMGGPAANPVMYRTLYRRPGAPRPAQQQQAPAHMQPQP